MKCQQIGGCEMDLPPGAAHVNLESCVQALRACKVCGSEVTLVVHPGCVPAVVGDRAGKLGTRVIEQKIMEWLMGRGPKERRPEPDDRDWKP